MQRYKKTGLAMFITLIFVLTSFGQVIGVHTDQSDIVQDMKLCEATNDKNAQSIHIRSNSLNSKEFIDQSNGGGGCGGCGNAGVLPIIKGTTIAQSFIPTHTTLSKINLSFTQNGNPISPIIFTLSIRASLTGNDLVSVDAAAAEGTVMFDFADIEVIPGNTYYMICYTNTSTTSNEGYGWQYTGDDSYSRGSAWTMQGSGSWSGLGQDDMFFDTYWKDFSPEKPVVEGPANGKAQVRYDYTITATDPEEDNIMYYVDWGDGKAWKWIGPYSSDELITKSHQWAQEGEYTIRVKAKDIYGVESEWSDPFSISMPKTKGFDHPLLKLFEHYPTLLTLLEFMFQL